MESGGRGIVEHALYVIAPCKRLNWGEVGLRQGGRGSLGKVKGGSGGLRISVRAKEMSVFGLRVESHP